MNMMMQRGILAVALTTILSLVIPFFVYRKTSYKPDLNQTERMVVDFTPTTFEVVRKDWQPATLRLPLANGIPTVVPTAGTAALSPAFLLPPPPAAPPALSFVLQDGGKSTAIIGGSMVKTGDQIQGWTVERIERNRVLIRNRKGATWLTLN